MIDLRSDTVTRPSPAMRRAMAEAEVGDDVLGDDPTVNALEARAAELLGKEAGLFVASGTMGNLVAQMAHLGRGQETIAGREQHVVLDEAAGHAVIVGTSIRALQDRPDGTLDPAGIEAAFRDPNDVHEPITGLVTFENTHGHSMGQPLSAEYTRQIADIAHARGVPLHIDGARFWNAVVALGVESARSRRAGRYCHVLPVKGAGLPRRSRWSGNRDVIWRARRARKMVGGGMRQVGILAAAGLVALSDGPDGMIARLADDHANARRLAEALSAMDGVVSAGGTAQPGAGPLDPARVRTDFVMFRVERDRAAFLAALRARGVLMIEYPHGQVRAVTHYGVAAEDIETAIVAVRAALNETSPRPISSGRVGRRRVTARHSAPERHTACHARTRPLSWARSTIRSTTSSKPVSRASSTPTRCSGPPWVSIGTMTCWATAVVSATSASWRPTGRTWRRSRRWTPPGCRPKCASSGTSRSTTCPATIFDTDVLRIWERRSFALDTVGDSLFLLFARDHASLPERLDAIAGRLEAIGLFLEEAKTRATVPQVGRWQQLEIDTAADLPNFFDEIVAAGANVLAGPDQRRLERAAESAKVTVELYSTWLEGTLATAGDGWAIGRARHDAMVALRDFDGFDADAILALGWERLAEERTARATAARRSIRTPPRPRSLSASRRTSQPPSPAPSTPIGTRCCVPAAISSSTTS